MTLSRPQLLAILDLTQDCDMYDGVDITTFADAIARDGDLATYVSQHIMLLPEWDKLRVLGEVLEYERQEDVA